MGFGSYGDVEYEFRASNDELLDKLKDIKEEEDEDEDEA